MITWARVGGAIAAGCIGLTMASAAMAEDFYKGRTISFIIGSATGGGYDAYSRLVARHLGTHLPGNPSVVAQNMPGANSLRATNHLYSIAAKDGTVIGMVDQAIFLYQILGTPGLTADVTKFVWIGRVLSNSAVLFAWHTAPVKKIEDAYTNELIVSTSGASSKLNWTVLNEVAKTKFKIITGYPGTNEARLAMVRGEVHALSMPWTLLKIEGAEWLKEKQINLLVVSGLDRHPDLLSVPRMIDLAKNEDDRKLLELFSSSSTVGRSVLAPPGVPDDRIQLLRTAFMAAMKDPALLDEVNKMKLELEPLDGEALQKAVAAIGQVSPAIVERAKALANANEK
jgi:tripartite-type tricarboxylate transporter receptor subunit TctC